VGAGLVTIDPATVPDPAVVVLPDPVLPEERRFCPQCRQPVGRSRDGRPGRIEGFCPKDGTPYSFRPKLRADDVIDHRYDIAGCLAYGGLGWIYLARDRKLNDKWVVLKGMQNADDEAFAVAKQELQFLAEVDHPNIVNVLNFVEHDGEGYIVMEYVGGPSLRDVMKARREANGGKPDPLPVEHTLAFMIDILPALGYLHERGRLFCDFKPDNVIQNGSWMKLIDLGAVYRADDKAGDIYGTPGYDAPEIATTGPTIPSDLFTVGRTIAVLCTDFKDFQGKHRYALPAKDGVPAYETFDSLYRLLERATAANPADRFQSADEMSDQLTGVLREVMARQTGQPATGPSPNFTVEVRGLLTEPDWRTLPLPLVDLDDPGAPYLATLSGLDGAALIDALQRIPEQTVEVRLQIARAHLDAGAFDDATAVLDDLVAAGSRDWRVWWYRGLHALAAEHPAAAGEAFASIYRLLPGDLAPKLALGVAAEANGDHTGAAAWYETVARTDPWFLTASFGLARCRLALDDVSGAIAAYDRIPETSAAYNDAQVSAATAMLDHASRIADVQDAARLVDRATLEPARRDRLVADVLETALPLLEANGVGGPPGSLLGHELTEHGLRVGLERTYRSLARRAGTPMERVELVDHANHVRPRTLT
jgi:serine/threonine-protein kinase PknG